MDCTIQAFLITLGGYVIMHNVYVYGKRLAMWLFSQDLDNSDV